jgi:hypothetical protein
MDHTFIVSWDHLGLEAIVPIDGDAYSEDMHSMLADSYDERRSYLRKLNSAIQSLVLRARMNPQRNYEIYSISTDGIDEIRLRSFFKSDPQTIAGIIREKGEKIYSDRVREDRVFIK